MLSPFRWPVGSKGASWSGKQAGRWASGRAGPVVSGARAAHRKGAGDSGGFGKRTARGLGGTERPVGPF